VYYHDLCYFIYISYTFGKLVNTNVSQNLLNLCRFWIKNGINEGDVFYALPAPPFVSPFPMGTQYCRDIRDFVCAIPYYHNGSPTGTTATDCAPNNACGGQ
jgi:hypothetical protein